MGGWDAGEDDLQGSGFGSSGEHVVGFVELVHREMMGHEASGVDAVALEESSVGVVYVSTRPVVMVTSRIQRSSMYLYDPLYFKLKLLVGLVRGGVTGRSRRAGSRVGSARRRGYGARLG